MKRWLTITVSILCVVLVFSGCAVQSNAIRFGETAYAPKPRGTAIPVLVEPPTKPYEVIGMVTADKQAATTLGQVKEQDLYPALIEQARLLGADAIYDVQFETYVKSAVFSSKNKHALKASAKAIRYTESHSEDSAGGNEG
jgi:hypothetical protein